MQMLSATGKLLKMQHFAQASASTHEFQQVCALPAGTIHIQQGRQKCVQDLLFCSPFKTFQVTFIPE